MAESFGMLVSIVIFVVAVALAAAFTLLTLHLLVPLVVRTIGERHFAEMRGLDGITISLFAGFCGVCVLPIAGPKLGFLQTLWAVPIASFLAVLYGVAWLWLVGLEAGRREFSWKENELVRRSDEKRLKPTCIEQSSDYHQTDAFLGYSIYFLTLYNGEETLARNGYRSESEMKAELRRVLETFQAVPCRGMDLIFVWQQEPLYWHQVWLGSEWTTLLCGPLAELSDEGRAWWRHYLLPTFPEDGFTEVGVKEFQMRVAELGDHYLERIEKEWRSASDWKRLQLLSSVAKSPIQIMTSQRHELVAREVAPEATTLMHEGEGIGVRIS